ncbi:MAG: SRPBCC family protein, partial [Actinomycetota bacterium]|nr:SRPBCC family protein [Actinomycetota bacterium]
VHAALFGGVVVRASATVSCTVEQAWRLIADVTRIGEFSPECVAAGWLGDLREPRVGARFEGTSCKTVGEDVLLWVRPCTVLVAAYGRAFGYVVGDRYDGSPAGRWDYVLDATEGGCRISLSFRHAADGLSGLRLLADADPVHAVDVVASRCAELRLGMEQTLSRMKLVLEQ